MAWTDKLLAAGRRSGAKAAEEMSALKARFDSWANAMTGLATARDKTTYTLPSLGPILTPVTLEALYHDDDIAARIVSTLPDECFREGFTVVSKGAAKIVNDYLEQAPGDFAGARRTARKSMSETLQERADELQADLDRLGTREKYRESMTWGRLYGLGAMLIGVDDGLPTWEPIDWGNVRGVDYLTVLDKRDLTPWRWYADPQQPKFSDVAIYLMQPVGVYVGAPYDIFNTSQILLVHESRMIRFGGELTSKRLRLSNQGADYSVLQKAFRALQLTNDNWQSVAALLSDASQGVITIKGLINMIAQQPDVMQTRFQFMDMARSVFRSIVLDADGEKFERVSSQLEGLAPILEQTWLRLASAARMPLTKLMGRSPAGLNATGESDTRGWYDDVRATQEQSAKPQLERLLRLLATAKGWDAPEDWSVVFAPLWQMTEKEKAEINFAQAQADQINIVNGVATATEIALSRFGGGKLSLDTKIDTQSRKRAMALELEQLETEAANAVEMAKDPAPTPGVAAEARTKAQEETPDPGPPKVTTT